MLPSLYGLTNSNRDFSKEESWGKNQFNSSFPAALCNYFEHKNIPANYLIYQNGKHEVSTINISDIYGISSINSEIFFAFESQYMPFATKVIGSLPRTDLVLQVNNMCLRGLEVKLTALPDNTTCNLAEQDYGCELVIRPDTIVYLACSLSTHIDNYIKNMLSDLDIKDWSDPQLVLQHIPLIIKRIKAIAEHLIQK